jgi:hypothetical protein
MEFAMGNNWWARQDSNLGPMDYESTALTTELRARGAVEHSIALVVGSLPKACGHLYAGS